MSACARLGGGAGAARQDLSCALGKARSGRGAGTSRPASVSAPSCGTPLPPAGSEPCRCPCRSADAPPFSGRQCEPPPAQPSSPQRPSLSSAPLCRGTSDLSLLLSPSRQPHCLQAVVPRLLCQGHHDPHVSGSHGPALLAAGNRQSVTLGPASPHPWTLPLTPPWQQPCLCPQTSALVSAIHTPSPGPQAGLGPPGPIWTLSRLISVHPLHLSARVCGADRRLNVSKPNSGGVPSGPPQFHPSASRAAALSSLLTQKSGLILDFSLSHTWPSFSKSCWLYLQNVSLI